MVALASAIAAVAILVTASEPALAQDAGAREAPQARRAAVRPRPRIVVTPRQLFYRQCEDRYVIENRATGPTVVPEMRCWWISRNRKSLRGPTPV